MACKNSRWKAANQSKDWRTRKRYTIPGNSLRTERK